MFGVLGLKSFQSLTRIFLETWFSFIHSTRYKHTPQQGKQMVLGTILETTIQWDRILLTTFVH